MAQFQNFPTTATPKAPRTTVVPFADPMIGEAEEQAVLQALRAGRFGAGPEVEAFEAEFASFIGARHAVAVNSPTAAMHVALAAINTGPGDEVILSPFAASDAVSAVLLCGARPVFADVDPTTLCLDPRAAEAAITPRTVAIVAFHYAGHPSDVEAFQKIAHQHKVALIEDCSHALPAVVDRKACGTFGQASVFSFSRGDALTTGEGAMVVTDDSGVAARVRRLSNNGMERRCWSGYADEQHLTHSATDPGYGYAMGEVAGAIGRVQLTRQAEFLSRRRSTERAYHDALIGPATAGEVTLPADHVGHAWRLYAIQTEHRDALAKLLLDAGVAVQVHFQPVHLQPAFGALGNGRGSFPVAEGAAKRSLSLPMSNAMETQAAGAVVAHLRFAISRSRVA